MRRYADAHAGGRRPGLVAIVLLLATIAADAEIQSPLVFGQADHAYAAGQSVRYIDFENGSDRNDGLSPASAWQHHPWDAAARDAADSQGTADTYVFKRGVSYRGRLQASRSGEPEQPIRLTSDPTWGEGHASLLGSQPIEAPWRRCSLPAPARGQAWCARVGRGLRPDALYEIMPDGQVTVLRPAREPDWRVTVPDDPRAGWHELDRVILVLDLEVSSSQGFAVGDRLTGEGKWRDPNEARDNPDASDNRVLRVLPRSLRVESRTWRKGEIKPGTRITNGRVSARVESMTPARDLQRRLVDGDVLTLPRGAYDGAVVWAERESMPKPIAGLVSDSDPSEASVQVNFRIGTEKGPTRFDRYYLEGLLRFLDEPGEFHYARDSGIVYLLREEGDDPPSSQFELPVEPVLIEIRDRGNIEVSGLRLAFANGIEPGSQQSLRAPLHAAALQIRGDARGIKVANCLFEYLPAGIVAAPDSARRAARLDAIEIVDNRLRRIDGSAIALGNGFTDFHMKGSGSRLGAVTVSRNDLNETGLRTLGHWGLGSQGHGIVVEGGEVVEIAGNRTLRTGGAGIMLFTGAEYSLGGVARPFLRSLVHHNTVKDSLLTLQDFGGISVWHGGPAYVFNNVSINAVGFKHAHHRRLERRDWYRRSAYGVGIYLDSQYKAYAFNNLVVGKNNDVNDRIYNAVAFNEAAGFANVVFNNTFVRHGIGIHKGMYDHNRSYYLGNVMADIGHAFIKQEVVNAQIEPETLAYSGNVMHGDVRFFGQLGRGRGVVQRTLPAWRRMLERRGAMRFDTGTVDRANPLVAGSDGSRIPVPSSAAVGNGVRVFVPWALSAVVGEWHFLPRRDEPQRITDESILMDERWIERGMYADIPRADLVCRDEQMHYIDGPLESWTSGALTLHGGQRCVHQFSAAPQTWRSRRTGRDGAMPGHEKSRFDVGSDSFLIEAMVRVRRAGVLLEKYADGRGYRLGVDADGQPFLSLGAGDSTLMASGSGSLLGEWHHLLVEVSRDAGPVVRIYVDGVAADVNVSGGLAPAQRLNNDGLLTLAPVQPSGAALQADIDFLRIARGTLADARTDIEALHEWQFNGPQDADLLGRRAGSAGRRDAGAFEGEGASRVQVNRSPAR